MILRAAEVGGVGFGDYVDDDKDRICQVDLELDLKLLSKPAVSTLTVYDVFGSSSFFHFFGIPVRGLLRPC